MRDARAQLRYATQLSYASCRQLTHAIRRLLFICVIALFGAMNLGAAVGFLLDRHERAAVLEQLRDEACGFRVTRDGAFVWRFALDALPDELAAPSGPAVVLASILGIPFARLRAGLPVRPCCSAARAPATHHSRCHQR